MKLCSICLTNAVKYTCPACETKTCSIECVRRHKTQTKCSGQVDQSRFIGKRDLSDSPLHINRDYNFLMKLGRDIQVGKRDVKGNAKNVFKRTNNSNHNRNKRQRLEEDDRAEAVKKYFPENTNTVIKRQNTMVILLPDGMSRSVSNKTGYDKKSQAFTWTVQWIFVNENTVLKDFISYRINENLSLDEAVPISVIAAVQDDIQKEKLHFYLKNVFKSNKEMIVLDKTMSLADNLKGSVVLEYPTIYVTETEIVDVTAMERAYIDESETSSSDSDSDSSDSDSDSDSSDSSSESGEENIPENIPEQKDGEILDIDLDANTTDTGGIVDATADSSDEAPEEHSSKS